MDLFETIARSLAEELKPPTGTMIAYTRSSGSYQEVEYGIVMCASPRDTIVSVTVKHPNLIIATRFRHYRLNYCDPQSIDRLQEILDEAAIQYCTILKSG